MRDQSGFTFMSCFHFLCTQDKTMNDQWTERFNILLSFLLPPLSPFLQHLITTVRYFLGMFLQALDYASTTWFDVRAELFDITLTRLSEFLHSLSHLAARLTWHVWLYWSPAARHVGR